MTTAQKTRVSRYLARLAAMARMAEDSTIGGQREVAAQRLELEAAKFAEYGFSSKDHALGQAMGESEGFAADAFKQGDYPIKKGSSAWLRTLFSACAYQCKVFPVIDRSSNRVLLFGPEERIALTKWLFEQLRDDIKAGASVAWDNDFEAKYETTKRSFFHAYCTEVASSIHASERQRYDDDRRSSGSTASPTEQKPGLVVQSHSVAASSYALACEKCRFKSISSRGRSNSSHGRNAGASDSGRYSARRMTSGARAIAES